jgi:hypothetical protein
MSQFKSKGRRQTSKLEKLMFQLRSIQTREFPLTHRLFVLSGPPADGMKATHSRKDNLGESGEK